MKKIVAAICACALLTVAQSAFAQEQPKQPKPSRAFLAGVVSAVKLYTEKSDAPAAVKALGELEKKEPGNFYVNSWLGYIHMQEGRYEDAVAPYRAAQKADPSDTVTMTNLAVCLDKAGRKDEAYEAYRALNAAKPGNATVLNKLGLLSLDRNDAAGAVAYLEEADKASPNDKVIVGNLASAYMKAKETDKGIATYDRLVALEPDRETLVAALSWLGFAAVQNKQYDKSIGYLERARELRENDLEVLNNLANAYANVTPPQTEKAAAAYRQMVASDPNLYEPWYNLGVLYLKQEDADRAIEANQQALKRKPGEPFASNNLGRAYEMKGQTQLAAESYAAASNADPKSVLFAHNAGVAFAAAKDDLKAIKYLERAVALGDEDPDVVFVLGELYGRNGRTEEAAELLVKATDRIQNRADLWFNLGVAKQKKGDTEGAAECYRKALEIKPDDIDANQNLALILWKKGDVAGATTLFAKVAGMNPSSIDAKLNLAAAYYKGGRVEDAVDLWKQVLQAQPKRTDVRLNLASTLWSQGDYEGAHVHYKAALAERPKDAMALNGVGLWQLRESKTSDAVASFRAAVESNPKYLPAYNNLAVALERLNKRAEAIAVLERAVKIDPRYEDAQRNLKRLKSAG
ncbi:MAG: tetratricopeptide repeat protein [Armatimonadetes bacterium]|nr:tetratricopeptide repeat protein [Armatimonadota bacterium]